MYSIGIDLGGTNIAVGICDADYNILYKTKGKTGAKNGPDAIVSTMARLTDDLMKKSGISYEEISFVGIGTPGIANSDTGIVEYSCNLPFRNFPLAAEFKKQIPVERILIANDANAAALAEALVGAARGTKTSLAVTLGTGVGGGIIIDGKIFSGGASFAGGEIGHTVIVHGGKRCGCGRRGCWEAYSSAPALKEITKERMEELKKLGRTSLLFDIAKADGKVGTRTAFKAMRANDPYGKEIVLQYIDYLATGIVDMINIFQPEVITVGGGVSGEGDDLIIPLREAVKKELNGSAGADRIRICRATLGNDAGIVGAAGLGRQNGKI